MENDKRPSSAAILGYVMAGFQFVGLVYFALFPEWTSIVKQAIFETVGATSILVLLYTAYIENDFPTAGVDV